MQLVLVSKSAVLTLRLQQKKFRKTALRFAQSLSYRPRPVVVDVDATSSSTPTAHILSEGDFFPTDTEAALKQYTKPELICVVV